IKLLPPLHLTLTSLLLQLLNHPPDILPQPLSLQIHPLHVRPLLLQPIPQHLLHPHPTTLPPPRCHCLKPSDRLPPAPHHHTFLPHSFRVKRYPPSSNPPLFSPIQHLLYHTSQISLPQSRRRWSILQWRKIPLQRKRCRRSNECTELTQLQLHLLLLLLQ